MACRNPRVSSARRKQRKAHFSASSMERRKRMSSSLSKDLRTKYGVRSLPIRRNDEIVVARGSHKGHEGKVIAVYRKRYVIYIDRLTKEKANGQSVQVPMDASNVKITKIYMDKDRKSLILRKKGKIVE